MKFYEFDTNNFSYYSLIGAESEETAKQYYTDTICDIFPDDKAQIKELSRDEAKEKFLSRCKTHSELIKANTEFNTRSKNNQPWLFIVEGNLF